MQNPVVSCTGKPSHVTGKPSHVNKEPFVITLNKLTAEEIAKYTGKIMTIQSVQLQPVQPQPTLKGVCIQLNKLQLSEGQRVKLVARGGSRI